MMMVSRLPIETSEKTGCSVILSMRDNVMTGFNIELEGTPGAAAGLALQRLNISVITV